MWLVGYAPICPLSSPLICGLRVTLFVTPFLTSPCGLLVMPLFAPLPLPRGVMVHGLKWFLSLQLTRKRFNFVVYIYTYIYSGGYSYQGWSIEQGYGHTTLLRKVTRVINGCLKRWLNVNGYIRRHKHTHSLAEGTDKQSTVL